MITRISIRGFQRHRKRVIDFDPRVTVIVGPTDAGKTSILEAIKWVALNETPRGEFIHWGETKARVTLTVDDHTVTRRRDSAGNHYALDEENFKAFGVNVPEPISNLLRITDDNFQGQMDSPFWIRSAGGQIAKDLNRIVDLGLIDDSLAAVAGKLRIARTEKDVAARRLAESRQNVEDLSWVPEFYEDVAKLAAIDEDLAVLRLESSRIDSVVVRLRRAVEGQEIAAQAKPAIDRLVEMGDRLVKIQAEDRRLRSLIENIKHAEALSCKARRDAKRALRQLSSATSGRCPLCGTKIPRSRSHAATCTSATPPR